MYEVPVVIRATVPGQPVSKFNTSGPAYLELRVTDSDLVPIAKRRVEITDGNNKKINAVTNALGRVLVLNLRPGSVTINAGNGYGSIHILKSGNNAKVITIANPH